MNLDDVIYYGARWRFWVLCRIAERDSKKLAKNCDEAKTVHRRLKSIFRKAKNLVPHGTEQDVQCLLARID